MSSKRNLLFLIKVIMAMHSITNSIEIENKAEAEFYTVPLSPFYTEREKIDSCIDKINNLYKWVFNKKPG